ncbi:hypothetical protein ElyMa_000189600 [Elysia marginata]|uniref:Uncharacterized protein n=1 Tax=Elysia marginata TaxID=1093978 RepID=A0AAV4EVG6_9GAST|nr:hypothetical protein ElyMa_000189600 [Elysia marginata]
MEPSEGGIEATDLASLLHRFEEAVTPPATPVPPSTVTQQASVTQSLLTVISKDSSSPASKAGVTSSQLQVRPRAVYASNKPAISLLPFKFSTHSTVKSVAQTPNIIIRASVPPCVPQVASQSSNTIAKTAFQLVPASPQGASLLLVESAKQGAIKTTNQAVVKPASQTAVVKSQEKQVPVAASYKPIRIASKNSKSIGTSTAVASTSSNLLQSMLLDKNTCIIPKTVSAKNTKLKNNLTKLIPWSPQATTKAVPVKPALSLLSRAPTIQRQTTCQNKAVGLSQSLPSSPTLLKTANWIVKAAEHDYCVKESQITTQSISSSNACESPDLTSDVEEVPSIKSGPKVKTVSDEEARTISSLDAELLEDLQYLDNHFGPSSPLVDGITNVLEDGEVMVDADGNDSFPQLVPSVSNQNQDLDNQTFNNPENMPYQSTVAFNLNGEESVPGWRRGRRYRRRTELNTSPIREDKTEFFDKIPAFYTALSIPKKPTKMSVFASATKSLGSTDHLAPDNIITEQVDNGLYDKVPAHRRCFTNTTKDLDLNPVDPSEEQSQQPVASSSLHPMSSSLLSSSSTELNPESSSPQRFARSRSRRKNRRRLLSSCSGSSGQRSCPVSRLGSRSRSGSRHSKERLRSRSQSGSISSRSCSTCSSHSRSSCGSSCSGCSRSRSRSCSTCCSSESSRSRYVT